MLNSFKAIKNSDLVAELRRLKKELRMLREEIRSDHANNPERTAELERNIHFLNHHLLSEAESVSGLIRRAGEIPAKETHYDRNRLMPLCLMPSSPYQAMASGWDGSVGAACHQFTSPDKSNRKFVSPDGKSEVIFDRSGHIVTASEDYGTYNFADSRIDPVGHFYRDVLPWLLWGNDEADSTTMRQRLRALVVDGGLEALFSRSSGHELMPGKDGS